MGLKHVWIKTLSDGLIRADQIVGLSAHRTPELVGKASRWLLDATLAVPAGSGNPEGWDIADLHRTLVQTDWSPRNAPEHLARALHKLEKEDLAGIVRPVPVDGEIQFEFTPFDDHGTSLEALQVEAAPALSELATQG